MKQCTLSFLTLLLIGLCISTVSAQTTDSLVHSEKDSVVGLWKFNLEWLNTEVSKAVFTVTFKMDSTQVTVFNDSLEKKINTYEGTWVQHGDTVRWTFKDAPVFYTGIINGGAMKGTTQSSKAKAIWSAVRVRKD